MSKCSYILWRKSNSVETWVRYQVMDQRLETCEMTFFRQTSDVNHWRPRADWPLGTMGKFSPGLSDRNIRNGLKNMVQHFQGQAQDRVAGSGAVLWE